MCAKIHGAITVALSYSYMHSLYSIPIDCNGFLCLCGFWFSFFICAWRIYIPPAAAATSPPKQLIFTIHEHIIIVHYSRYIYMKTLCNGKIYICRKIIFVWHFLYRGRHAFGGSLAICTVQVQCMCIYGALL